MSQRGSHGWVGVFHVPPPTKNSNAPVFVLLAIKSLSRDHLAYCNVLTDHQQCLHVIVREQHALTVSQTDR